MKIANVVLGDFNVKPDWSKLCGWLKKQRQTPDIVTLQKIGPCEPRHEHEEELCNVGYKGWYLDHKEDYRGVGILAHRDFLSRPSLSLPNELDRELPDDDQNESRFLTVRIGDLLVSSIYVPWHDKISPRVDWLDCLRDHVEAEGYAQRKSLLCGDFNVPKIDDKSKGKLKQALGEIKELGFCDLYRQAHPDPEEMPGHTRRCGQKYQYPSRLHLILASRSLAQGLGSAYMEPEPSLWPREDAPPLVAELAKPECDSKCGS